MCVCLYSRMYRQSVVTCVINGDIHTSRKCILCTYSVGQLRDLTAGAQCGGLIGNVDVARV